jgi:hypothetical protein
MALFIIVEGSKIVSYGKSGDIEISSWPSVDGHPAIKDQCYWNGSSVLLKTAQMLVDEYAEEKLYGVAGIRELLYTRWPDSSKTIAALKAQYDVVKSDSSSWTSLAEVDTAYDNFVTFMDLS